MAVRNSDTGSVFFCLVPLQGHSLWKLIKNVTDMICLGFGSDLAAFTSTDLAMLVRPPLRRPVNRISISSHVPFLFHLICWQGIMLLV